MTRELDADPPARDLQVLVVGGGLGGLSTAAFLRKRGFEPTLVTARDEWNGVGHGITLWNTGVELLAAVGVAPELFASAIEITSWRLRTTDEREDHTLETAHPHEQPFLTVERKRLLELLRSQLPADSVRMAKRLRAVERGDGEPVAAFEGGVRERFDVVVGADGTQSAVRSSAFDVAAPTKWGTRSWAFRTERAREERRRISELWSDRGAALAFGPLAGADTGLLVSTDGDDPGDVVRRAFDEDPHPALSGAAPFEDVTAVGGDDYVVRPARWVAGRVALVGDAAHTFPPGVTIGPSLTVEDAYVLAAELAAEESPSTALRRYERRRRRRLARLAGTYPGCDPPTTGVDAVPSVADVDTAAAERFLAVDEGCLDPLRKRRRALLRAGFGRRTPGVSVDVLDGR